MTQWKNNKDWKLIHLNKLCEWHNILEDLVVNLETNLEESGIINHNKNRVTEKTCSKETILIADDDLSCLLIAQKILENSGYDVITAIDGREALKMAEIVKPTLILLDVQMPEMNGHQVCRKLKANPRTRDIPIIFGTASVTRDHNIAHGFILGAVDYIPKPYDQRNEEFIARIETHIKIDRMTRELRSTLGELETTRDELLKSSYHAGMFQVAVAILHNIGNTLNSVNLSSQILQKSTNRLNHNLKMIKKAISLIMKELDNADNLPFFLAHKGKDITRVLDERFNIANDEIHLISKEARSQCQQIDTMLEFLREQRKIVDSNEIFDLSMPHRLDLIIEKSLRDHLELQKNIYFEINCPEIKTKIHVVKFQYIFQALISSSILAMKNELDGELCINVSVSGNQILIHIIDNGVPLPTNTEANVFPARVQNQ